MDDHRHPQTILQSRLTGCLADINIIPSPYNKGPQKTMIKY